LYETPPILKLACWLILILLSPILIPLYIATTPLRMVRRQRENREEAARRAPAEILPMQPPEPVDPELVRRRALARRTNKRKHPRVHFLYDPINDDPAFAWAIKEAGQRVDEELGPPLKMGSCHCRWRRKKEILKEEFGIDWYSTAEMNPGARFD
jgi:Zn-dependent protease with chaperone function